MAVFNINTDFSDANDIKQVKSYLYKLNDQLQYMFANMTVEDNYSDTAQQEYEVFRKRIEGSASKAEIEVLSDQISLKVDSEDLGNSSLTIKPAAMVIESGGTIEIKAGSTFTVSSENFNIDSNGAVSIKGDLCVGTMESWGSETHSIQIQGPSGASVASIGNNGYSGLVDGFVYGFGIGGPGLIVNSGWRIGMQNTYMDNIWMLLQDTDSYGVIGIPMFRITYDGITTSKNFVLLDYEESATTYKQSIKSWLESLESRVTALGG